MSLNNFKAASHLIEEMKGGPQFVRITAGPRKGTVGRVQQVRSKYFSVHDFQLAIKGRRAFWAKGSDLEHLESWKGSTHYVNSTETPSYNDLMGRLIEVGQTLLFPRGCEGARVDMVLGTVQRINDKGVIYAQLFKSGQGNEVGKQLVRVAKPGSAIIIDRGTTDQVILAKLAAV